VGHRFFVAGAPKHQLTMSNLFFRQRINVLHNYRSGRLAVFFFRRNRG
jgi:hypothetical protein